MADEAEETPQEERRLVSISITPKDGVDAVALYKKITETITSQPEYKLRWDEECKVEGGKILCNFTIAQEADFDEEVMDVIGMMEDEVAAQKILYQAAME